MTLLRLGLALLAIWSALLFAAWRLERNARHECREPALAAWGGAGRMAPVTERKPYSPPRLTELSKDEAAARLGGAVPRRVGPWRWNEEHGELRRCGQCERVVRAEIGHAPDCPVPAEHMKARKP